MRLGKYHGLGNDFLVLLGEPDGDEVAIDGDLAVALCDRRTGLGADGLIYGAAFANHSLQPIDTAEAQLRKQLGRAERAVADVQSFDVVMHLYNSDGSRGAISGNGIRCLAHALVRSGRVDGRNSIVIATDGGQREIALVVDPTDLSRIEATVSMGAVGPGPGVPPDLATDGVVLDGARTADVGNPHLIVPVTSLADVDVASSGADLERNFEGGINVHFVEPAGQDSLRIGIWERGAGITLACGSGATAVATAAHRAGEVGEIVTIEMPGGAATVTVGDDESLLTGPSVHIADIDPKSGVAGALISQATMSHERGPS